MRNQIISGYESDIMNAWLNHARGAIKLLELRGAKQLESSTGLELFRRARIQIVSHSSFDCCSSAFNMSFFLGNDQYILQDKLS